VGPAGGLDDAKNLAYRHPAFAEVADEIGCQRAGVTLAELALSPVVIPIPGAKRATSSSTPPRRPTWS
jgi:hypothetical protein